MHCRPELDVTEAPQVTLDLDDRKLLANLALHPRLMECVMDFLYRPYPGQVYQFQDSLPMQLRLVSDLPQANFEQVSLPQTPLAVIVCKHHAVASNSSWPLASNMA